LGASSGPAEGPFSGCILLAHSGSAESVSSRYPPIEMTFPTARWISFAGVALAHVMFDAPLFSASRHVRAGVGQLTGEFMATFGLVSVIWGCSRTRTSMTPFAVAVISVCDAASAERCPIFPGVTTRLNWSFADPSAFTGTDEERLRKTIAVRDEIRQKVRQWVDEEEGKQRLYRSP
jgi:hypothetical protein